MMSLSRLLSRTATLSRGALSSRLLLLPVRPALRAPYSAAAGLSRDIIQTRVLDALKKYEKIDPAKLTPSSAFFEDLGLDSLDTVEVLMVVEEEFDIVIPDVEADEILKVDQAIDYIAKTPEAA